MIDTRLRDYRGGSDSNVPQAEDRGTRQRPARRALAASGEGWILRVGLLLTAVLLVVFAIGWAQWPERTHLFAAMTVLNLVIGRAAGMSFGYASGMGHAEVIATNVVVESIQVLIVYSLFALSWQHLLDVRVLRPFMSQLHATASARHDAVRRFGIAGLFLFVFTPFWMTGPVVGSIVGFLLGLRPVVNLTVVLLATYVAIGVWALLLNQFSDWAATFNRFAPFGLVLAVVLLGLAARIVHRRRPGGIRRMNGAQ